VPKVKAKAGNRRLDLSWVTSADTQVVNVIRSSSARNVATATVYSGKASSFRDTRLKVGAHYQYTVTAVDQAGNSASKTLVATATGPLLAPAPGERVTRPPLLVWTAIKGAGYYNLQLVRGKKIFSVWPTTTHFQLPRAWTYNGHRYRLHRGVYRWYVWPGFGSFSAGRYGGAVGGSSFLFSSG
jgi:hypothetical protein